jgi:CP family cyanate transporter-like MFS transporter
VPEAKEGRRVTTKTEEPTPAVEPRWARGAFVVGVVLLAFNLRPAITSLPPIFPELEQRLGLSSAAVTLLATTPVLCFAVFSGLAAKLSRRLGEETTLGCALVSLALGLGLRGLLPASLLFPATVLACAAVAVMNVLLSSLIKRRRPDQAGLLLGVYLLSLYVGATLGSLSGVFVYHRSSGSLLATLGVWAAPAALAGLIWVPQLRHRSVASLRRDQPKPASLYRHRLAWQVTGFMGLQSLIYYATLSWLPTLFRDRGATAGHAAFLASMLSVGGLVTALVVPIWAQRLHDQRALVVPAVAACAVGLAGTLLAPMGSEVAWTALLGLGQGASFGLALYFTMARAATPAGAASLSAMAQGVGYLLAATGPLVVGFLHAATGHWQLPVALLLALSVVELAVGLLAAREVVVEDR